MIGQLFDTVILASTDIGVVIMTQGGDPGESNSARENSGILL